MYHFIKTRKQLILLFLILLLAIILRFINYGDRWGLAADQARDVLIVREALRLHTLPLIGPFSASGPFVFGPLWYWVFMIPIGLFPNNILSPWIFQGLLYIVTVVVMYFLGKKLIDQNFGLLVAFFSAISPARIKMSTNLIMSSFIGILTAFILFFFATYLTTQKKLSLLLIAFLIGFAINVHPEAIPLVILLPFAFYFGKRSIKYIALSVMLFFIPFTPLIIFNFLSHNYELNNIFNTHKQLAGEPFLMTYAKQFILFTVSSLPNYWGYGFGGNNWIGAGSLILLFITIFLAKSQNKLQKEISIIFSATVCMIILVGIYNGTLFGSYFSFLFPFVIVLSAWLCLYVWTINKLTGVILSCVLVVFSLIFTVQSIDSSTNNAAETAMFWENALEKVTNKKTFQVFDYRGVNKDKSLSLSMFLDIHNKIADNGMKIGIGYFGAPIGHQVFVEGPDHLRIYNLDNVPTNKLNAEGFTSVSAESIYDSVENWWKS